MYENVYSHIAGDLFLYFYSALGDCDLEQHLKDNVSIFVS